MDYFNGARGRVTIILKIKQGILNSSSTLVAELAKTSVNRSCDWISYSVREM